MKPLAVPQFSAGVAGIAGIRLLVGLALGGVILALVGLACQNTVEPVARSSDRTPPGVREHTPAAAATGVATDTPIEIVFSEAVDPATVTLSNFRVSADGTALAGVIRVASGTTRFEFVRAVSLLPKNSDIQVTVGPGVADPSGNVQLDAFLWSFSTGLLPGTPITPSPADSASDLGIDPTLTWDVLGGAAGSFEVYLAAAGEAMARVAAGLTTASFLAGPLAYETEYVWQIVATVGGELRGGPLWRFTTTSPADPGNVPPAVLHTPDPASIEFGVTPDRTLGWSGGEDASDPVTFEVYLGTTDDPPLVGTVGAREFDPPEELQENLRYRWRVIADDGRGGRTGSPLWGFHTGALNQPPAIPSGEVPVDGKVGVSVAITLGWAVSIDPDEDPVTYDVYFGIAETPELVATGLSVTTYNPTTSAGNDSLQYETRYYWRIVAHDGHDNHAVTGPIWSFDTGPENSPPSAPCDPVPEADERNVPVDVVLRWACGVDPDEDQLEFDVYFEAWNSADPESVATVIDRTYVPPDTLETGVTYSWRIVVRDDAHPEGVSSPVWTFYVDPNLPPEAPSNPIPAHGAVIDQTSLIFRWQCSIDPNGDPVQYKIYVNTVPSFGEPIETTDFGVCASQPFGIFPANWYWRVDAIDVHGATQEGDVWQFSSLGDNDPPSAPCDPEPEEGAENVQVSTSLSWSCGVDPNGDTVVFDVYLEAGVTTEPQFVGTVAVTTFTPQAPLEVDTPYSWRIVARDNRGAEASGPVWSFETDPNLPPAPPCNPQPEHGDVIEPRQVFLRWGCAEDPTGDPVRFDVYAGTSPEPVDLFEHVVFGLFRTLNRYEVPIGTTYWRVVAIDIYGGTTPGPIWEFTRNE